jgi:hypothetical protein
MQTNFANTPLMNAVNPFDVMLVAAQRCISAVPLVVLGSGASIAHGLPSMQALRDYIVSNVTPETCNSADKTSWKRFVHEVQSSDLETALIEAPLTEALTQKVIEATWDCLAPFDLQVFEQVVQDRQPLPLTLLFQHIFRSTRKEIDVVTPNYDRITEYAADVGGLCHSTGFGYGHLRLRQREPIKLSQNHKQARTVNIWKVHGSLDWFRDRNDITIGLPIAMKRMEGLSPAIVTPGIDKYRLTHNEPFRTIITGADNALENAAAYLCIGYGFNDKHIQPKLVERCQTDLVPIVVITKVLSKPAKDFLLKGKCRCFMALEESDSGTRMYTAEYLDGIIVSDKPIWQLDHFLNITIL